MKARLFSTDLLVASLGGCASSMQNDECYANLRACLLVGTAQTGRRHDKKKRGR